MVKKQSFRKKRGDTKLKTIEKQYGVKFDERSDMRLDTFLDRKGYPSLSKAIRSINSKKNKQR